MSKQALFTAFIALSLLLPGCKPQPEPIKSAQNKESQAITYSLSKRQINILVSLVHEDLTSFTSGGDTLAEKAGWSNGAIASTAQGMQKEYETNEVAADKKFRKKDILLTATVKSIDRGIGENYFLQLKGGSNIFISPRAQMADGYTDYLANLKKGQQVELACIGAGMLIGSATLEKCIPANEWVTQRTKDVVEKINEHTIAKDKNLGQIAAASIAADNILPTTSSCNTNASNKCASEVSSVFKKISKADIVAAAQKLGIDPASVK